MAARAASEDLVVADSTAVAVFMEVAVDSTAAVVVFMEVVEGSTAVEVAGSMVGDT